MSITPMALDEALRIADEQQTYLSGKALKVLAAEVRRLQKPTVCLWWESGEMWESSCGVAWQFTDGGPIENDCAYCNKCGSKIEIVGELEKQK